MIAQKPVLPHIGLNAHLLSLDQSYRAAGISWYIYNVLKTLNEVEPIYRYTVFLREKRFQAGDNLTLHYSSLPTYNPIARILWEQLSQPLALKQAGVDLHHAMAFVAPMAAPCPFVITVYDLSFKRYPEAFKPLHRFYLKTFTAQSVRRARAVITISESTRQDVLQFFDVAPQKVHTVHCGVDDSFQVLPQSQVEAFKVRHGLPDVFVLFLGTIEPRKNVAGLLKAYADWRKQDPEAPKLFIGGGKGWYYQQVFALVEALNLTDHVVFPGYLPQEDLRFWYNAATMFVYPSYFEGFGLPVLEAMACGTPVITSDRSSLPEVAGDAAYLIDPDHTDALSNAMRQVFNNLDLQQAMKQKGLMRRTQFSWQNAAIATLQVYNTALRA